MRLCVLFAIAVVAYSQTVSMVHNDLGQTSAYTDTRLTPSNVTTGKFGRLGTFTCGSGSELIFTQPLFIPNVAISGSHYDVLIVATLANTLCAFDANTPGSSPLWSVSFGTGRVGWSNNTDQFFYCVPASCNIGMVGTPVVDTVGGFVYIVSATATPTYLLHKLNIADGTAAVTAVTISGQVVGTGSAGDPTSGPNLLFSPTFSNQRPGLLLSPDRTKVYISFGGGSSGPSNPPWHGWEFAYNTSNLTQSAIFCTTPNAFGGSIWVPPAMDSSGNLYIVTGSEGTWDGLTNFPDSLLKLSPSLVLLDWFTPSNHVNLDDNDFDYGSNWARIIPGTNYIVTGGKDYNVYVNDITCLGHLQGSSACSLQTFATTANTVSKFSGSYGGVFANNALFLPITLGATFGYTWGGSTLNSTPFATDNTTYGSFGPSAMSLSSNGSSNGILWVTTTAPGQSSFTSTHPGTLRARSVSDLTEYWNSDLLAGDALGVLAKFASPVIAGGKVFVSTQSGYVAAYGLLLSSQLRGGGRIRNSARMR